MSTTRCDLRRLLLAVLAMLALALVARPAAAQEENREAARPLFEEARRLMAAGNYKDACAKLEETRKLYAGAGVLLNLGDCYEHLGRTASAWKAFGESADAASRAGRSDEEAEAKRRRSLLDARVPHLVVQVPKPVPGLAVTRDGDAVPQSDWGRPVPVDPGVHDIKASAAGYSPRWETQTTVPDSGQTVTVAMPELEATSPPGSATADTQAPAQTPFATSTTATSALGAPPPEAPAPPEQPKANVTARKTQRVLAIVSGATGVATMGLGGVFGLIAKSKYDSAQQEGAGRHADSVSAVHLGNVATGLAIAGGALAGAGIILWFTAPTTNTQLGSDGRQILIGGVFE